MNRFDADDPDDRDPASGPASMPGDVAVESLLRARPLPVPNAGFRDSVLGAMEVAACERRLMLASQARIAPAANPRQRLLPEIVAGIAAALVVSVVPWGSGSRTVVAPEVTAAVPAEAAPRPVDEPADVRHALSLLDARRDLFAAVAGVHRQGIDF
jgi:hypothetical protein